MVFFLQLCNIILLLVLLGNHKGICMRSHQMNRFLGVFYVVLGFVIFFLFAWDLLFKVALAAIGLFIVSKGLKMQGYPTSRLFFMAQQWRSHF